MKTGPSLIPMAALVGLLWGIVVYPDPHAIFMAIQTAVAVFGTILTLDVITDG